jgi:hypothetical protein
MFINCPGCHGTGKDVGQRERGPDGTLGTTSRSCLRCGGSGRIYEPTPASSSSSSVAAPAQWSHPSAGGGAKSASPTVAASGPGFADSVITLMGMGVGAYAGHSGAPDNGWAMLIGALIGGGLAWTFKGLIKALTAIAIIGVIVWSFVQSQGG